MTVKDAVLVLEVLDQSERLTGKQKKAIAYLIAAVPELLEACKDVLTKAFKHEIATWKDAAGTDAEKLEWIVRVMRGVTAKMEGQ